ncbi:MAG: hypothetical protein QOG23_2942 [Blastocatellia bacterium]|jgi:hypothetical protein|nr:hypothetical protein [Blastocatellia bacterium]
MKLLHLSAFLAFPMFLMLGIQSTVQAKLSTCAEIQANTDFLALADRRAELMAEAQELRDDIGKLEKQLPEAMTVADLEKLKQQLSDLEKNPARTPLQEQTMQNLQTKVKLAKTDKAINDEIAEKKRLLAENKDLLLCVQGTISQLSSPGQAFKTSMSYVFAAVIFFVIFGFFTLAFRDKRIGLAIFSGEAGLQFLTLFSLVIAIILFGITSILEGKELSALLGGLSGYILGRTGSKAANGSQTASPAGLAAFQKFINDLKSITVVPSSVSLSANSKARQLVAEPRDTSGAVIKDSDKIFVPVWESSDTKVAKVDQTGLVSMVGTGTCTVTASFANITSNPCQVTCI